MAHFPDLAPYDYYPSRSQELSVGWLDRDHAFDTAPPDPGLLSRLETFLDHAVHQTRGLHGCHFCKDPLAYRTEGSYGSAEMRVFDEDGTVYAAPTLIIHYIAKHHYAPPDPFVRAVMTQPIPPEPAYLAKLQAHGAEVTDWAALRAKYPGEF